MRSSSRQCQDVYPVDVLCGTSRYHLAGSVRYSYEATYRVSVRIRTSWVESYRKEEGVKSCSASAHFFSGTPLRSDGNRWKAISHAGSKLVWVRTTPSNMRYSKMVFDGSVIVSSFFHPRVFQARCQFFTWSSFSLTLSWLEARGLSMTFARKQCFLYCSRTLS